MYHSSPICITVHQSVSQFTTCITVHHMYHSSPHVSQFTNLYHSSPHVSQFTTCITVHHMYHSSPHVSQFTTCIFYVYTRLHILQTIFNFWYCTLIANLFYYSKVNFNQNCVIFKVWTGVETLKLCLCSCCHNPEDGHMSGRNML